jgi:hypothetical protein
MNNQKLGKSIQRLMSKGLRTFLTLFFLTTFMLLLGACSNSLGNEKTGTITINLGSARAVMPWPDPDTYLLDKIDYIITLINSGDTITITAKSSSNIKRTVPTGHYSIKVDAYLQGEITPLTLNGERMHYATGTNSVDVRAGQTSEVSISMVSIFCRVCNFHDPTSATCTEPSKVIISCEKDPAHNGETIIAPALGHNYTWAQTQGASYCIVIGGILEHGTGLETGTCTRNSCSETDTRPLNLPCLGTEGLEFIPVTGEYAVGNNQGLTVDSVCIPEYYNGQPVTSIGANAFGYTQIDPPYSTVGNQHITSVRIPASVKSIGGEAFVGCASLTSMSIPAGVNSIGASAFALCSNLASISIPEGITFGAGVFNGCTSLSNIPAGITSISAGMFQGCTGLISISIPASVSSIGAQAFRSCDNLTSVTFEGTIPSSTFAGEAFSELGDLRDKFYADNASNGTPGTYTTSAPVGNTSVWTRQ